MAEELVNGSEQPTLNRPVLEEPRRKRGAKDVGDLGTFGEAGRSFVGKASWSQRKI